MERLRDQQGVPWIDRFSLDVTLALRMLRKHWGVTLITVIAMALPIALGAVLFAFFETAVWKAPPLDEGDRLVALQSWDAAAGLRRDTSVEDFERWRATLTSVDTLGAFRTVQRNFGGADGAPGEPVSVAEITPSGFDAARTRPLLGRPLIPADLRDDSEPAVVIGYLVYARNVSRQDEFAARCALGATRRRIVAQLFVEALALAGLAAATALAVAHFVLDFGQSDLEQSMGGTAPFCGER